ncbi:MAG: hypothetical protein HN509_02105 [Halobacteriovoraceae bacterium]|jgi:hypothetical protein|nr:hypothetical protein [Halobacteriovoraceae bacterium]MBT5093871.1 hypothetical protein [Halobacteriovoraceae bacterium]
MKIKMTITLIFGCLMFSGNSFAEGELNKLIEGQGPEKEQKEEKNKTTKKKRRRKKVQMCHQCGKPEPECECEGEGHGVDHHDEHDSKKEE